MSKTSVGDVYAKVINDVCEASRVDFEEGGVELSTLDLLKLEWQKKLSGFKVAHLPWDPTPAPPAKEQPVSNNTKSAPTVPSNGNNTNPQGQASQPIPNPQIKQDPQPYPQQQQQPIPNYQPPQYPQNRPLTSSERAAMLMHAKFGNQAGTQIAQLQQQNQGRVPMPNQNPNQQTGPYIKREDSSSDTAGNFKSDPSQSMPIKSSQNDGAMEEYRTEIAHRRAMISRNRMAGDRLMRAHFMASQQELEGGGLLMPLDERNDPIIVEQRVSSRHASSLSRAQGDAADDDDDEEDEDAINSDLDDPDELDDPQNEEAEIQEVMLCTYDKVQRVKNKWKCTLKDGILRVEGAEYVFHKGQGEFEW